MSDRSVRHLTLVLSVASAVVVMLLAWRLMVLDARLAQMERTWTPAPAAAPITATGGGATVTVNAAEQRRSDLMGKDRLTTSELAELAGVDRSTLTKRMERDAAGEPIALEWRGRRCAVERWRNTLLIENPYR